MKKCLLVLTSILFVLNSALAYGDTSELAITERISLDDGRTILVDSDSGLTLYTFDVDDAGVSNCFGGCLGTWPAFTTEMESLNAPFGIHIRPDGVKQVTLNDEPLYFFIGDRAEGDITGNGLGGVWHIITE